MTQRPTASREPPGPADSTAGEPRPADHKTRFLVVLFALSAFALIACGSSADSNDRPTNFSPETESRDLAPDFPITMFQGGDVVGGEEIQFGQLLGTQPVVLNFWAGLCPPCRAEMPDLQEFYDDFEDRTLLIGIDLGQFTGLGSPEDGKELLEELGVTYPAGFTFDNDVVSNYQVLGMPSTIFIDANGVIAKKWTGALNREVLEEETLKLLNQ